MEEHLLKILEANSRVIIPEFGAFIVKQKNPLSIVFNEFLQYNDGLLVDFIVKEEDIERDVAKKKIDDFVKKVREELSKDNMVSLGKMGVLVKSHTGKISLEDADTAAQIRKTAVKSPEPAIPDKKEAETVSKNDDINLDETIELQNDNEPVKEKPEPVAEKPKTAETKTKPVEEKSEKSVPPAGVTAEKTEKKEPETKEPVFREPETKAPETKTPEIKVPETRTPETKASEIRREPVERKPPVIEEKKVTPPPERREYKAPVSATEMEPPYQGARKENEFLTDTGRKKKRRVGLIIWILAIILVNGAIVVYFLYGDQFGKYFSKSAPQPSRLKPEDTAGIFEPAKNTKPIVTKPQQEPKVVKEKNVKPKPVVPQKEKPAVGPRYYIVAGVFRSEANADALARKLRNEGFNAKKFGKIGSYFGVCYGSYATRPEADQALLRIKRERDKHAWIKKME